MHEICQQWIMLMANNAIYVMFPTMREKQVCFLAKKDSAIHELKMIHYTGLVLIFNFTNLQGIEAWNIDKSDFINPNNSNMVIQVTRFDK